MIDAGENPAARYLFPGMNTEVASSAGFETARGWLERCIRDHSLCPLPRPVQLPARVVDVSIHEDGNDWVQLHVTNGVRDRYIALSYCWGMPVQPVETTTATFKSHIDDGISLSALPATIRDAIEATRRLGIRYLWIDCLCIVQDDKADKTKEIAQMRRIYSNAYCTISAANISKVTESFLEARPTHSNHVFPLPYACPNGAIGTMMIGETLKLRDSIGVSRMQFYDPYSDPINQRAWTLEEKLLSPRILSYASNCLRWLCDSAEWSDGGDPDARIDTQAERLPHRMQVSGQVAAKQICKEELQVLYERWRYILEDYTNRYLTNPRDKLRAISGVADYFHRLTSDQYLAGLWKPDLMNELVWFRAKAPRPRPPNKTPSWSWASVNGPVYFLGLYERREFFNFEVLGCNVIPLSELAPFGEVAERGTLRVRGLLKDIAWDGEREKLLDKDGGVIGSAIIDVDEEQRLSGMSTCLAVSALRRDEGVGFNAPCGLMLSPVGNPPNHFSRIGAFVTSDRSLFNGVEQQELTII